MFKVKNKNKYFFQRLNDKVSISYQVTAEGGPGGIVSSRDFIFIFKVDYTPDGTYVQVIIV
jgi:hypothetical protein